MTAGALSSAPLWYATRSTGVVAFVLLTISLAFGVAATQRSLATPSWPRFATQDLHRNISLLALVMLFAHILTTLVDTYVHVGWWALLIPGTSPYQRLGVTMGTVAFDLLLAVVATSLVRSRVPARLWRMVHWTSYAVWPLAFTHFLMTGTDAGHRHWGMWLAFACVLPVAAAVAIRVGTTDAPTGPLPSVARGVR